MGIEYWRDAITGANISYLSAKTNMKSGFFFLKIFEKDKIPLDNDFVISKLSSSRGWFFISKSIFFILSLTNLIFLPYLFQKGNLTLKLKF